MILLLTCIDEGAMTNALSVVDKNGSYPLPSLRKLKIRLSHVSAVVVSWFCNACTQSEQLAEVRRCNNMLYVCVHE